MCTLLVSSLLTNSQINGNQCSDYSSSGPEFGDRSRFRTLYLGRLVPPLFPVRVGAPGLLSSRSLPVNVIERE